MTSQLRRLWACLGKVRRRPTAIPMKASEAGPSLTQNRSYLDGTGQRDPLRDIQLLDFEHRRANHCPRQRPAATAWDLFLPHCAPSIPHPPSAWLPLRGLDNAAFHVHSSDQASRVQRPTAERGSATATSDTCTCRLVHPGLLQLVHTDAWRLETRPGRKTRGHHPPPILPFSNHHGQQVLVIWS